MLNLNYLSLIYKLLKPQLFNVEKFKFEDLPLGFIARKVSHSILENWYYWSQVWVSENQARLREKNFFKKFFETLKKSGFVLKSIF